jgi:hypothetical protein
LLTISFLLIRSRVMSQDIITRENVFDGLDIDDPMSKWLLRDADVLNRLSFILMAQNILDESWFTPEREEFYNMLVIFADRKGFLLHTPNQKSKEWCEVMEAVAELPNDEAKRPSIPKNPVYLGEGDPKPCNTNQVIPINTPSGKV